MTVTDATVVFRLPRQHPNRPHNDPWGEHYTAPQDPAERSRWWAWVVPGLAMLMLGSIGLSGPALWTDELQTWGMSVTSWHQMWPVMRWVDAVLAPYYTFTWAWAHLFGGSDVVLRLPSVLAMAGTAALVGALGARLASARAGLLAGLVLALLPASSRFAQEARPYALTTFAATLATLLLVRALDRPTLGRFAGYAAAVALAGLMNEIAVLLLAAHAWYVLAFHRRASGRWLTTALIAALPLLPLFWFGYRQRNQVAFIRSAGFYSFEPFTRVVLGGAAVAVAVALLALFALPLRQPAALFTAWAVVPTTALILISLAVPMFLPRYLVFTLPAWALLAGRTIDRFRTPWAATALAGILALGISAQVTIRQPDGHEGQATRDAAAILTALATPADGVVYALDEPGGGWTTRDLVAHYVPANHRPRDLLATRPPRTNGQLLAGECAFVARCLGNPGRIWVIRLGSLADPLDGLGPAKEVALRGYRVDRVWRPGQMTVALFVPVPAAR